LSPLPPTFCRQSGRDLSCRLRCCSGRSCWSSGHIATSCTQSAVSAGQYDWSRRSAHYDITDTQIAAMNGLLQKLNDTVVNRRSSTSGSAISSTFGSVFSTAASSAAAAATPGVPSVIYPCSVRPIPFTVPTFPSSCVLQPPGRSSSHAAVEETGGIRSSRAVRSANYNGVDNYGRGEFYADYRGKKTENTATYLDQCVNLITAT